METNTFLLQFKNAESLFDISSVDLVVASGNASLEIEAKMPPLQGSDYGCGPPLVRADWRTKANSVADLVDCETYIPKSYDEILEDHVTNFYFSSHNELNDCRMLFTKVDTKRIRIELTGYAPESGVDFGEESENGVAIRVIADFSAG